MYQALYRKWRPRTFSDVVGQEHITTTLTQQIATGRLSHAYLFTGTRGTGKTSCAKILSRAVNCEAPVDGNPCNCCPACLGIESGSIMDVLELDAASNNGVDQVRALRDEAVYTPAAVRRRVYIVDEVHMLSTPAFNALLKILEEPPEHLLFILATTELHKVPATIRSRCQQFTFKRILPQHIAGRLTEIATAEHIPLTQDGAELLARLADGGLRDALSLLDQCAMGDQQVDAQQVLNILGLAGNLETAQLMEQIARRDSDAALQTFARLYQGGRDVEAVLSELSALCRDLLLLKTAPQGGAALLTGGYDQGTLKGLLAMLPPQRLIYILQQLQQCAVTLSRSTNRRTDGELCLLRITDERLEDSPLALSARLATLEEGLTQGISAPVIPRPTPTPPPVVTAPVAPSPVVEAPPWEMEEQPPLPDEPPMGRDEPRYIPQPVAPPPAPTVPPVAVQPKFTPPPVSSGGGDTSFWSGFMGNLRSSPVPASVIPYFTNPDKVMGCYSDGVLTLWVVNSFTKSMLDKPAITGPLTTLAAARLGCDVRVAFQVGKPPVTTAPPTSAPAEIVSPPPASTPPQRDALDELLELGAQFDNITIN